MCVLSIAKCFKHECAPVTIVHSLTEVREALSALYLKRDSSKFHHLLGFTNVSAVNEDEFRPDSDEVLGDVENRQVNAQDNLLNKMWNNVNVNKTNTIWRNESIKKTKIEESTNVTEDDAKKDTILVLRENY